MKSQSLQIVGRGYRLTALVICVYKLLILITKCRTTLRLYPQQGSNAFFLGVKSRIPDRGDLRSETVRQRWLLLISSKHHNLTSNPCLLDSRPKSVRLADTHEVKKKSENQKSINLKTVKRI